MAVMKLVNIVILALSIMISSASANSEISQQNKSLALISPFEPALLSTEEAFEFQYSVEEEAVSLSWAVKPGYYLYLDRFDFESHQLGIGQATFPQPIKHRDPTYGLVDVLEGYISASLPFQSDGKGGTIRVTYQGCSAAGVCYFPVSKEISVPGNSIPVDEARTLTDRLKDQSIWVSLVLFFALGVGLSVTPCVFPMYPILSGVIAGQGGSISVRKGFTLSMCYVQGMAVTFTGLGLLVASAGVKYQAALQQPAVIIATAILFAVLSLSMFGLYQLQMPDFIQSKLIKISNSQSAGSYVGATVMGAISGLICSPCTTAPLSGALIYVAQTGDLFVGGATLYVLSVGMSLPLLVIGAGGGKLLPKAGGWMNTVKKLFGVLMLAVAISMLDRVLPTPIVVILGLNIIVALLGFVIGQGVVMEGKKSKVAIASMLLVSSLTGGVIYGKSVLGSSSFEQLSEHAAGHSDKADTIDKVKQQMDEALALGKPVVLDFYADWCTSCKEMDEKTFGNNLVQERLAQAVVIKVDVTANTDEQNMIMEKLNVLGLPTILFFNDEGYEMDGKRVTGYMAPETFLNHIKGL
ncbi:protein-disulfide reductase DsbD (plasmid) [Vibrio campbellii]|uniref:protein-disulfide reductase DsbD n=1 Tax=Vibrio campbellii TaxID=680 RepID=UPI001F07ADEA|nr:protein-disulfide reductase DsbD [Vibrio campbellii]UMM06824.1 protein-disulfide reductase DsbD [Vibrio campbellii]